MARILAEWTVPKLQGLAPRARKAARPRLLLARRQSRSLAHAGLGVLGRMDHPASRHPISSTIRTPQVSLAGHMWSGGRVTDPLSHGAGVRRNHGTLCISQLRQTDPSELPVGREHKAPFVADKRAGCPLRKRQNVDFALRPSRPITVRSVVRLYPAHTTQVIASLGATAPRESEPTAASFRTCTPIVRPDHDRVCHSFAPRI